MWVTALWRAVICDSYIVWEMRSHFPNNGWEIAHGWGVTVDPYKMFLSPWLVMVGSPDLLAVRPITWAYIKEREKVFGPRGQELRGHLTHRIWHSNVRRTLRSCLQPQFKRMGVVDHGVKRYWDHLYVPFDSGQIWQITQLGHAVEVLQCDGLPG